MELTKEQFKADFERMLSDCFTMDVEKSDLTEQYVTLGKLIGSYAAKEWRNTNQRYLEKGEKQVYYFSMEFLLGRMLKSNLFNLGILDTVRAGLQEMGMELEALEQVELDAGLGNGGLGRWQLVSSTQWRHMRSPGTETVSVLSTGFSGRSLSTATRSNCLKIGCGMTMCGRPAG